MSEPQNTIIGILVVGWVILTVLLTVFTGGDNV